MALLMALTHEEGFDQCKSTDAGRGAVKLRPPWAETAMHAIRVYSIASIDLRPVRTPSYYQQLVPEASVGQSLHLSPPSADHSTPGLVL